jgi:flagellar protein FliO/FliZ
MIQAQRIAVLWLAASGVLAEPEQATSALATSPLSVSHLIDTGLGLVLVVAIMLALAWLVKRYVQVPGLGKGQVQVLGGVSLGAREKAVLLSVEGRRLLVGVAPGRVQTLLHIDPRDDDAAPFAEQLNKAVGADAAGRQERVS